MTKIGKKGYKISKIDCVYVYVFVIRIMQDFKGILYTIDYIAIIHILVHTYTIYLYWSYEKLLSNRDYDSNFVTSNNIHIVYLDKHTHKHTI